jgi:hypothetical protein
MRWTGFCCRWEDKTESSGESGEDKVSEKVMFGHGQTLLNMVSLNFNGGLTGEVFSSGS